VAKLNAAGTARIYATFLGGPGIEFGSDIAVDAAGNAYATGFESSPTTFPTTPDAFLTAQDNGRGPFLSKLDPTGSTLLYSTYLTQRPAGGGDAAIALDGQGNFYVAGAAPVIPVTVDAFQKTAGGQRDVFIYKFSQSAPVRTTSTSVSAANYTQALASESLVAAFGRGFTAFLQSADAQPLPTKLGGVQVKVKDSAGMERLAPLFFVSPNQINYQIPAGTNTGTASVTIENGGTVVANEMLTVVSVAPGLFSANADGRGVAAAVALRINAAGVQTHELVTRFDQQQNRFVAIPLDLGPAGDQVFLMLFGTGLRNRSALSNVTAKIGGVDAPVSFAGAQGQFVGLDQINIGLPRTLVGRGEVDVVVSVDGKTANTVRVNIK
jgi:uncharacterized protein (TIGR03437 family)